MPVQSLEIEQGGKEVPRDMDPTLEGAGIRAQGSSKSSQRRHPSVFRQRPYWDPRDVNLFTPGSPPGKPVHSLLPTWPFQKTSVPQDSLTWGLSCLLVMSDSSFIFL